MFMIRFLKKNLPGYLFISPWLFGFIIFTAFPILASIVISFCDWNLLSGFKHIKWIGLGNYIKLLGFHQEAGQWVARDPLFWQSLKVTFGYTIFAVPLGLCGAIAIAMLMNQKIKGITSFRTIYYLPAVVSGVATAVLWRWVFNPEYGLLNYFLTIIGVKWLLTQFGLELPLWLASPTWALPAFIFMSLWGVGGAMVIYLAGLQGIPRELYEVAELDGAGVWKKFTNVTLPLLSPTIFFNLIMGIIGSFQVFTSAYIMTSGGPANSTLFYGLYLFRHAFVYYRMGYASAMAWILFVIILFFTLVQFRYAKRWVYYHGEKI
jgi:multiple sugar transport system permease protein